MHNLRYYSKEQYEKKDSKDRKIQAIRASMEEEKLELIIKEDEDINKDKEERIIFNIYHKPKGSKE